MNYTTAIQALKHALSGPRNETNALALMAPRTTSGELLRGREPPPDARQAAGLVLVFPDTHRNAVFVLAERSLHLRSHPGQIGLPGGMQSPGESLEATARREAEEEIGIDGEAVTILGALSPVFIPPSNFLLHPFAGHLDFAPRLTALPREVTRIFEIPLSALLDEASVQAERRRLESGDAVVPYFHLAGEKIWGATAIVLAELRALLLG